MGQSAQTGFNTADNHWNIRECLTAFLAVHGDSAIRAFATLIPSRVGIVMAQTTIRGVAIDHGVHIAGGHTKIQIGLAQGAKRLFVAPVRLRKDTHAKTLRF